MNECLEQIVPWIEVIENAITNDNKAQSSFEKHFCNGNELIKVYFSSDIILVECYDTNGTIKFIEYTVEQLNYWLDNGQDE